MESKSFTFLMNKAVVFYEMFENLKTNGLCNKNEMAVTLPRYRHKVAQRHSSNDHFS